MPALSLRSSLEQFHHSYNRAALLQRAERAQTGWHDSSRTLAGHAAAAIRHDFFACLSATQRNPLTASIDSLCGIASLRPTVPVSAATLLSAQLPKPICAPLCETAGLGSLLGLALAGAAKLPFLLLGAALTPLWAPVHLLVLLLQPGRGLGMPTTSRLTKESLAGLAYYFVTREPRTQVGCNMPDVARQLPLVCNDWFPAPQPRPQSSWQASFFHEATWPVVTDALLHYYVHALSLDGAPMQLSRRDFQEDGALQVAAALMPMPNPARHGARLHLLVRIKPQMLRLHNAVERPAPWPAIQVVEQKQLRVPLTLSLQLELRRSAHYSSPADVRVLDFCATND